MKRIGDRELVRALKALAHEQRLRMVRAIAAAGELSCSRVVDRCALSQPTISHHLKLLRDAGLLRVRREGKTHHLSVDRELLALVMAALPLGGAGERRRRTARP